LHPLIAGKNYVWSKKTNEVSTFAPSYEIHAHPGFVNSPLRHVSNGLGGVRQNLNVDYPINSFPIMEDLRAEGATDYVAMPLQFSDGRRHVMSLTSDHPDGFTTANLGLIFECSSVVSRFFEVFMLKENAQSLLDTYVGQRSGARVLGGDIRRGDGDDINAAIMCCDMRGSTALEEKMGRAAYIALLNQFFEITSDCVNAHQGEILKFIGDAVLAVFPAGDDSAAARSNALQAARDIVIQLNQLRSTGSDQGCDCSIGMAFGGVTYGNVGSRERLDFTVIGQAANVAARLGDYGKTVGHRIVATDDFLIGDCQSIQLGAIALRNVAVPVPCHAFDPP
jgi:adenylate cyclase